MQRVLKENEIEVAYNLARTLHVDGASDPFEAEMTSWNAPWRKESLEHYLKQGWSLGAWSEEEGSGERLIGFSLAQPLLFFNGLTQCLWLEAVIAKDDTIANGLLESSYRWARDKHLQNLVIHPELKSLALNSDYKFHSQEFPAVATAKIKG